MSASPLLFIGIFFVSLFFSALIVGLFLQRRRAIQETSERPAPDWVKSISDPVESGGERIASPISEAIEGMVQARMASDPSLGERKIDFGTSPDGALEIWVDDERYLDLAEIHDERIRSMIQEAVDEYNKGMA